MKITKYAVFAGLMLSAFNYPNQAVAHSLTGALADNPGQILGDTTGTADYYQVTCFNDNGVEPAGLITQVKDITPDSTRVGVQVQKNGATVPYAASTSTDMIDNDDVYSPFGAVIGGVGVYTVLVTKDGGGSQTYSLQYHCLDMNGQHAGTDINTQQNQ